MGTAERVACGDSDGGLCSVSAEKVGEVSASGGCMGDGTLH